MAWVVTLLYEGENPIPLPKIIIISYGQIVTFLKTRNLSELANLDVHSIPIFKICTFRLVNLDKHVLRNVGGQKKNILFLLMIFYKTILKFINY